MKENKTSVYLIASIILTVIAVSFSFVALIYNPAQDKPDHLVTQQIKTKYNYREVKADFQNGVTIFDKRVKSLVLETKIIWNYQTIKTYNDDFYSKSIDSIKCMRYKEAKEYLDKLVELDNLKCN